MEKTKENFLHILLKEEDDHTVFIEEGQKEAIEIMTKIQKKLKEREIEFSKSLREKEKKWWEKGLSNIEVEKKHKEKEGVEMVKQMGERFVQQKDKCIRIIEDFIIP